MRRVAEPHIQQHPTTLAVRQVVPHREAVDLAWTFFGDEDDTARDAQAQAAPGQSLLAGRLLLIDDSEA